MRGLCRGLWQLAVTASMMIWLGAVGAWVGSYWKPGYWNRFDYLPEKNEVRQIDIYSGGGLLAVSWGRDPQGVVERHGRIRHHNR